MLDFLLRVFIILTRHELLLLLFSVPLTLRVKRRSSFILDVFLKAFIIFTDMETLTPSFPVSANAGGKRRGFFML